VRERDRSEDQYICGWTILRCILRRQNEEVINSIYLAWDRDPWRALVNTVIAFRFHKMLIISRVAAEMAVCQLGQRFMELVIP
jgi:hypothetical protein